MKDKKIAVIGSGYVGLVTGACFAELGNQVICVDTDKNKIAKLKKNITPIYEPGLDALILRNAKEGRISFTTDIKDAINQSAIIFVCVGTPPKENGEPDLTAVENVVRAIALSAEDYKLIVEKSTVPVQTASWLKRIVEKYVKVECDVAVNPEFLREGSAIHDFMNPDRIVIGAEGGRAFALLSEIYKPLNAPILLTDINSAELIKHLSNAMLAQKISTINLVSLLCEEVNADIETVAKGVGMDKRIGHDFLKAGIGYGGFCFPKDLEALVHILKKNNVDSTLFRTIQEINKRVKQHFVEKIEKTLGNLKGKTLGILGLSFKPNTDDVRFAPSIYIISKLQEKGAKIKVYDPRAMGKAKNLLENIKYCKNAYDTAKNSHALIILTEWQEFKEIDLSKIKSLLKQPIIIDGRNIFNKERMQKLGFIYVSIGRQKI